MIAQRFHKTLLIKGKIFIQFRCVPAVECGKISELGVISEGPANEFYAKDLAILAVDGNSGNG
jgi:hypothetical protein